MDAISNMPQLLAYQPSLIALACLCLIVLIQSLLAGVVGFGQSAEVPGMPLKGSHSEMSFRILRTYANSTENLSVMVATAFLAILAGANANWVNGLVILHVLFRTAYWAVYYSGVGAVTNGPRTITYVLGWLMNIILAIMTIFAMAS